VQPWGNFFLKNEPEIRTSGVMAAVAAVVQTSNVQLGSRRLHSRPDHCQTAVTVLYEQLQLQQILNGAL
jgi:hypothetical protein